MEVSGRLCYFAPVGPQIEKQMLSQTAHEHSNEFQDAISIALFDDHERLRGVLAEMLGREPRIEVVATGASKADAMAVADALLPDVILLDVNMPGDGLECARELKAVYPAINIVMLTSDDSEQTALLALRAGASAVIDKGAPLSAIYRTITNISAGLAYLSPKLAELLMPVSGRGTPWFQTAAAGEIALTYREEQILSRLAQGLTPEEIGPSIGLAPETVLKFQANILRKVHDQDGRF